MEDEKKAASSGQPSQAPYWVAVGILLLAGVLLLAAAGFRKGASLLEGLGPSGPEVLPQMANLRLPCPDFTLKRIGGEEALSLAETEGSVTVLLATHSPVLLDQFRDEPEQVFVMQSDLEHLPVAAENLLEIGAAGKAALAACPLTAESDPPSAARGRAAAAAAAAGAEPGRARRRR